MKEVLFTLKLSRLHALPTPFPFHSVLWLIDLCYSDEVGWWRKWKQATVFSNKSCPHGLSKELCKL